MISLHIIFYPHNKEIIVKIRCNKFDLTKILSQMNYFQDKDFLINWSMPTLNSHNIWWKIHNKWSMIIYDAIVQISMYFHITFVNFLFILNIKGCVELDFISYVKNERTPKYQVCYLCGFNGPITNNKHYHAHRGIVPYSFA